MAKPLRLALGACIIQAEHGFSDEETAQMIQEHPYFQYFCGYPGYDDSKLPFDLSESQRDSQERAGFFHRRLEEKGQAAEVSHLQTAGSNIGGCCGAESGEPNSSNFTAAAPNLMLCFALYLASVFRISALVNLLPGRCQNHAACAAGLTCTFKRTDAQFLFHVVVHGQADDLTVVAVQNGGNIKLSVRARNLRDVGQPFLKSIVFRYIMAYCNRERIYIANPGGLAPTMCQASEAWPLSQLIMGVHILHLT